MAELKREYVVPLRNKFRTAPKWRRSKKAVTVLKEFIEKHMKTDKVVVCKELNEFIWANGSKNPPGKVTVVALKDNFANEEKTLVNLASVGLDEQLKEYAQATPSQEVKETVEDSKEEETVEAEVKEVKKETKKEEKPAKEEVKGGKN